MTSTPQTDGAITGEYAPSASSFAADHVAQIEAAADTTAAPHPSGRPVVLLTVLGARSGKVRKFPLMRVEHDGSYLAVASRGGAPVNPDWYHNLRANPDLDLLDGRTRHHLRARELPTTGPERDAWWERAVTAFPTYEEYVEKAGNRIIPLLVLEPRRA